jgi:orotate phosphoribosyltransferase-like protein
MPRCGARPDAERREQVAKLRAQGLTFTQIGKRLRMSRQAVHSLLSRADKRVRLPGVACPTSWRRLPRMQEGNLSLEFKMARRHAKGAIGLLS